MKIMGSGAGARVPLPGNAPRSGAVIVARPFRLRYGKGKLGKDLCCVREASSMLHRKLFAEALKPRDSHPSRLEGHTAVCSWVHIALLYVSMKSALPWLFPSLCETVKE